MEKDRLIFKNASGHLYQVVRELGEGRFVVIRITSNLKPDQRRKDSNYRSGYKEGVIDTKPGSTTSHFKRLREVLQ